MSRRAAWIAVGTSCIFLLGIPGEADAIDVSLGGSWTCDINEQDLATGAGSNLASVYESLEDEVELTITNTSGLGDSWRMDIRRTDMSWPDGVRMWVRRTNEGLGAGSVTGGLGYQEVTSFNDAFFSGDGDRSGIHVQLRMTGFSVAISPAVYFTGLTYSVTDT